MSLKYQIGLIGAVGVIGSLLFLGIYSLQMRSQDRQQKMMDAATEFHDLVQGTANDLLQARRHEKDFLLRRQDTYADQEIAAVASALDRMSAMEKLPATGQGDNLKSLGAGIRTYGDRFKQVVDTQHTLGLNENVGLQGELRNAVHDVEDLLGKYHETNLDNVMLMMRRHEKDFMLRLDPSYGDQMKKRAAEFTPALASSGLPAAIKAEVGSKMAIYQKDFFALLDGTMANVDNIKKLSESYGAVEPVLADLIKVADEHYDAAK
jgi:methyl-accepting chemotaxis protein